MKNHITIKFVAILLCTLTLLGCVGSAAGLYVMTEADLYNKTAEQVREDLIWNNGEAFAHEAALHYASQTLGGCSESMVENHFGAYWSQDLFLSGKYSYSILDGEGNEVYRQGDPIHNGTNYSFPVTGQYLHLVSSETEQDRSLREAREQTEFYGMTSTASLDGVQIPAEGLSLTYASFVDQNGSLVMELYNDGGVTMRTLYNESGYIVDQMDDTQVGYLMYSYDGRLVFRSEFTYPGEEMATTQIKEANFFAPGEVHLQLLDENAGVGQLYINESGSFCFTSLNSIAPDQAQSREPDVQAPDTLTINPTPGVVVIRNNLSEEITDIALAAFYGPDGTKLLNLYDAEGVGVLIYNREGGLTFLLNSQECQDAYLETLAGTTIAGVFFQNASGEYTYRATGIDGVGSINDSVSSLIWNSRTELAAPLAAAETAPAEEAAEETAETSGEEETVSEASDEEDAGEQAPEEEPTEAPDAEESGSKKKKSGKESSEKEHTGETKAPDGDEEAEAAAEAEESAAATEPPIVTEATIPPTEATVPPTEETIAPTEPVIINGKPLEEYSQETDSYYDPELGQTVYASYVRLPMPEYTVVLQLAPHSLRYEDAYTLLALLREYRKFLLPTLGICLLLFAICVVYLCTAAGRKPKCAEIHAGGLNRLPLDLYFALVFFGIAVAANIGVEAVRFRLEENVLGICILAASMAFLACLLLVAFGFALIAQVKTPGGYWYRNTLCGQCIRIFIRFAVWFEGVLATKLWPFLVRMLKGTWKLLKAAAVQCWHLYKIGADGLISLMRRFFRWTGGILNRFFSLLPITWQWLLTGCILIFIAALTLNSYNGGVVIFGLLLIVAIILYGAHCFGILSESARKMSKGDLNTKVEDKLLLGCFKEFAGDLNDLADVAVVAAQKQLRSERMKTELITNVSHDIKTPLTSIINYVDLLQKPHTEEQQEMYLEVLDRQSQRLKKLIDDLMEMSKASTGNMTVEVTTVDAVESVNQALGEFSDKLIAAHLTPVFRYTEERVSMMADGKLVWRVLSNLLGNAVKYAMPGTRLYIDLMELEGKVILSLKNISREELNLNADELMERFVRGDDSRNTEGSGLGLNIAKSLMELQKGQLQLLVDGDLFKVTLTFPGA